MKAAAGFAKLAEQQANDGDGEGAKINEVVKGTDFANNLGDVNSRSASCHQLYTTRLYRLIHQGIQKGDRPWGSDLTNSPHLHSPACHRAN